MTGNEAHAGVARHARRVSGHFDGERFFNPDGAGQRGFLDLASRNSTGPVRAGPTGPAPPRVEGRALRVTFVGHATFPIQGAGLNILTDPVWSERASPSSFIGPKRASQPGITFDDLLPIDVILVSHGHDNHLDVGTLARLWQRDQPRIVAPLGKGVDVVLEPVHHWTTRGLWDRNRALLPIGAYEPLWFMAGQHMNTADAVQGFKLLGARQALGYHWGTFKLTDEGPGRPLTDLAAALAAEDVEPVRCIGARPGLVWSAAAEA